MKFSFLVFIFLAFITTSVHPQGNKINQTQVIGSHNSYKQAIQPKLYSYLESKDTTGGLQSLEYTHITIPAQLDLGLRNLEIDVHADPNGGKYANPKGLSVVSGDDTYDQNHIMEIPGFKVFHIIDIDFRTSFYTLRDCLLALREWSDNNPEHSTVFITLEPKDSDKSVFGTQAEPFTATLFDALDTEIFSYLGRNKIIKPDDIIGDYNTLENAVHAGNWPSIEKGKGKFLFILDDSHEKKELYKKGHPNLKGRVAFVNDEAGSPEAAAMILNDPNDTRIPELVKKGYLIRTRADAGTKQARTNDYSNFEAAKKSGAQIITTDYYVPSTLFNSSYQVKFDDNSYERANPVNVIDN
ncbi:phosphatidylinositol-specific phospholipase C1-like protein [Cellulophaga sp. HaHaR_3_176]|uniref:phosphatidylinositol-specific phospholipase C1-like protein n=1 Tax=Cellulophaga sp. HaHaR_3_176 TaxID=1942464 RepID=UPI001C1FDC0A|nr:phosphatidylinositol-specific phospholipase C1-like protein [Cellulophaga sp. HaHaR_3_176]QWX83471.1 phosphatidylinositol-specific phospholipase C1-like protein [Cellulophaga sp. HaHaR_3_176]